MTTRFILPPIYADLPHEGNVCIEHAAMHCRIHETLLALALSKSGTVLFITPETERIRFLMFDWLEERPNRFGRYQRYVIDRLTLWVCPKYPDDIPILSPSAIFVTDAHRFTKIPEGGSEELFVAGELAERGSTFYNYAREHEHLLRYPHDQIQRQWPQEVDEKDPSFKRRMLLLDEEIQATPFFRFARTRLMIKTDKPPTVLHPKQRDHAEKMFGKDWHTKGQSAVVPFMLFKMQKRFFAKLRHIRSKGYKKVLLLKYRRGGYTAGIQGWMYSRCAEIPYTNVTTIAHNEKSTKRIFKIARTFYEQDKYAPKNLADSKTEMEFANKSMYFIGAAGSKGILRGDQVQIAHGSEVSKWCRGPHQIEDIDDITAGITGAAEHGWTLYETTPDGREWFCNKYEEAKKNQNDWYAMFQRWHDDPINIAVPGTYNPEEIQDTINAEEQELINKFNLTIPQIAFRRAKQLEYKKLFAQEMPEDDVSCFLTSGICLFDTDVCLDLIKQLQSKEGEERKHVPGGYMIIWKQPEKGRSYVAGCDTSEGLPGCDPSGVGVLDRETGEQVAAVHGLFEPVVLAAHAIHLSKMYNHALLGVERENHGHAVLQKIVDLGYGRSHYNGGALFYWMPVKNSARSRTTEAQRERTQRIGWSTNPLTRPIMTTELSEAVDNGYMIVNDTDFLGECLTFRKQSNGKFEADSGSHDDTVMKWAIAWQMRKHRCRMRGLTVLEGTL